MFCLVLYKLSFKFNFKGHRSEISDTILIDIDEMGT